MKIFVDANVIIDYLVDRDPFADDAEAVIDVCIKDGNEGAFTRFRGYAPDCRRTVLGCGCHRDS